MYRRLYVIRLRDRSQIERIEDAAGRRGGPGTTAIHLVVTLIATM